MHALPVGTAPGSMRGASTRNAGRRRSSHTAKQQQLAVVTSGKIIFPALVICSIFPDPMMHSTTATKYPNPPTKIKNSNSLCVKRNSATSIYAQRK